MTLQVGKWGNSAAVRIPLKLLHAADFSIGQEVVMREADGAIIIEPVKKPVYNLADMIAEMKPETFHEYVDFGAPIGNEAL